MGSSEKHLIDSLMRSLSEEQATIDSRLKQTQKYGRKLTKKLQKKQGRQDNKPEDELKASVIKEKIDELSRIAAQLREKLNTIKLKVMELNRIQIV